MTINIYKAATVKQVVCKEQNCPFVSGVETDKQRKWFGEKRVDCRS